jgi:hypothetical protein
MAKKLWNIDIETIGHLPVPFLMDSSGSLESNPCGEVLLGEINHTSEFSFDFEYLESLLKPSKESLHANTAEDLISAWEDKQERQWRFFLPTTSIRSVASLIGDELVSVQPLSAPIMGLHYLDFRYQQSNDCPICQTLDNISDEIKRL